MRLEVRVHGSQIPSLGVESGRPGPQGSGQQQPEVKKHMLFSTVNTYIPNQASHNCSETLCEISAHYANGLT